MDVNLDGVFRVGQEAARQLGVLGVHPHARWKIGQPAHNTTGVASSNCAIGHISDIPRKRTGTLSARPAPISRADHRMTVPPCAA